MTGHVQTCPGSFRDAAGCVYFDGEHVIRTIQECHAPIWQEVVASGFMSHATEQGLLVPFSEIPPRMGAWKSLQSPRLFFVSYPYEWCFGQLKAAALHTLDVLDLALAHGLILRDATAYNVQFIGARPVFIDLLSFEPWQKDKPWKAYGQFCRHFLAPLSLMAFQSPECGKLLSNWLEGIPLALASKLLPWMTRLHPNLALHIYAHAKLENKYADARTASVKLKQTRCSEKTIPHLSQSLRMAVEGLRLPSSLHTQWGEYYDDTNYTPAAAQDKKDWLEHVVLSFGGPQNLAIDVGANTGVFSRFLAAIYQQVLAVDIDYLAVEKLYTNLKELDFPNILPLVVDLCNPPPAAGWNNAERTAFLQRCQADYVSVLALVHHLRFTGGIPLQEIARCFAGICKPGAMHILEFVPMEDSQVQRMLAVRTDESFADYTIAACLAAYEQYFELIEQHQVLESTRTLLLLKRKV